MDVEAQRIAREMAGLTRSMKGERAINTFHGTPSKEPYTQFDPARYATTDGITEGAGGYSAEAPDAAEFYRRMGDEMGVDPGQLMAWELKGDPRDYINWDTPWHVRDPEERALIESMLQERGIDPGTLDNFSTGGCWYNALRKSFMPEPAPLTSVRRNSRALFSARKRSSPTICELLPDPWTDSRLV
jgi:hypothetical protein